MDPKPSPSREPSELLLCCPRCRSSLDDLQSDSEYRCQRCALSFPIVCGIADFRLFPDPHIALDDDRAKATRLEREGRDLDYRQLVEYYWSITPDTPTEMARRFERYDLAGEERGKALLDSLHEERPGALPALGTGARVLEIGSRSGGVISHLSQRFDQCIGSDIALRWLVIARRRLEERGLSIPLFCCCAQHLPFAEQSFDLVLAENVLEHTTDHERILAEAHRVLRTRGTFFASTWNRFAAAPEPHVRLWGVGWLPRPLARRYVQRFRQTPYDHVHLLSAFELSTLGKSSPFGKLRIELPSLENLDQEELSRAARLGLDLYEKVRRVWALRLLFLLVAPVFHLVACREARA